MFIAISTQEKKEQQSDANIANAIISLRKAIRSNCPQTIAKSLIENELPHRTQRRFEFAIEWQMLGKDKVELWKEIKEIYNNL